MSTVDMHYLEMLKQELYRLVREKGSFVDKSVVLQSERIDHLIVELQRSMLNQQLL